MAEGVCSTSSRTPNSQRVLPISLKGRVLRWKASRNNWRQEVIFTTMLEWSNGKEHCYLLRRNGKRIRQGSHERHQAVLCPRTPFATSDRLLPSGPRDHGATGGTEPGVKVITKLLGMAFGYGLPADVRDAYIFLLNNFESGDQIFLFGFSRGAFTVRVLASMLHMYGLIPRGNEPLVPYSIRMMTASRSEDRFSLASEFMETFSIS